MSGFKFSKSEVAEGVANLQALGITVLYVIITPDVAKRMLEANRLGQRPINGTNLKNLIGALRSSYFEFNGDSIVFNNLGYLVDGQHRLTACVRSGVAFETIIIYGINLNEMPASMDRGKPRSYSDWLKIQGYKNYAPLSGLVKALSNYALRGIPATASGVELPYEEFDRVLGFDPKMEANTVCRPHQGVVRRRLLTGSTVSACNYLFSRIDAKAAHTFFDGLATGFNLPAGSPIGALRDKMQLKRGERSRRGENMDGRTQAVLTIKAWNKFMAGATSEKLQWRKHEPAPAIVGCTFRDDFTRWCKDN